MNKKIEEAYFANILMEISWEVDLSQETMFENNICIINVYRS